MKTNRDHEEENIHNGKEFDKENTETGTMESEKQCDNGVEGEDISAGADEDWYKAQIAELNDKYLRLAAEFDNYRRRTLKERQELILTAGEDIISGILPVIDDLDRAIAMLKEGGKENKIATEGTELIRNKLFSYLTSKGVKPIEAVGEPLDTDLHEAVAQIPAPSKSMRGKVVDVAQQGYTLNGKVIRYAKVVVGQ